jgi:hypothetical protein
MVQKLFDNGWLHLLVLDDAGQVAFRYRPGNKWDRFKPEVPLAA